MFACCAAHHTRRMGMGILTYEWEYLYLNGNTCTYEIHKEGKGNAYRVRTPQTRLQMPFTAPDNLKKRNAGSRRGVREEHATLARAHREACRRCGGVAVESKRRGGSSQSKRRGGSSPLLVFSWLVCSARAATNARASGWR